MLEGSEESSDSGCEADSLLPPETEEGDAVRQRQQRRAEENGPFSLDKALGFVDFDSNDFDEVRENKSLFYFCIPLPFFTSPSLFLCIRRSATAGIIITFSSFLRIADAPFVLLAQLGEQHRRWSVTTLSLSLSRYTHLH